MTRKREIIALTQLLYICLVGVWESVVSDSSLVEFVTLCIIWDTKFSPYFIDFWDEKKSISWSVKKLSDIPDDTEVWSTFWNGLLWTHWFLLINLEQYTVFEDLISSFRSSRHWIREFRSLSAYVFFWEFPLQCALTLSHWMNCARIPWLFSCL